MSLIEEALRRMQEPVGPPASSGSKPAPKRQSAPPTSLRSPTAPFPSTQPSPRATQQPATPVPRPTNLLLVVVIAVLMLAAGLIGAGVRWIGRTVGAVRSASPPASAASPMASGQPPALNTELLQKPVAAETAVPPTGQDAFVLNGIVEGVGEPYAVINGVIVGIGDQVGDATLVDVRNGAATLQQSNGRRSVLRIPR